MNRRVRLLGVPALLTLALAPLVPQHATAQAASGTCVGYSIGTTSPEDQDSPMQVTISSQPGVTFAFLLRILNTGTIIGGMDATTDNKGQYNGALPTKYDPSRTVQGVLEFRQLGCNAPPVIYGEQIAP